MPQLAATPPFLPNATVWVLHLVPPNGGGVDRFVRDLIRLRHNDHLLHISETQWVLEDSGGHFTTWTPSTVTEQGAAAAVGRPAWLHAHSVAPSVRAVAEFLCDALAIPLAVTLHDIGFTQGDQKDRLQRLAFVNRAKLVTAPSRYITTMFAQWVEDAKRDGLAPPMSQTCHLIPNGSELGQARVAAPNASELCPDPPGHCDLAVVGAIGEHKGMQHLLDTALALPDGIRIVLLGYMDGQMTSGWRLPGRLWIHGNFEPEELPELLNRYGVRRVWFPAGQPESFCYALSDVWQAGWPVTVPDHGALGERVREARNPADSIYAPETPPSDMADQLVQKLHATAEQPAPHPHSIPDLSSMAAAYTKLYQCETPIESLPPPAVWHHKFAQHLDSRFFRKELLRLRAELESVQLDRDRSAKELADLSGHYSARGRWIEKLEADVAELRAAVQSQESRLAQMKQATEDTATFPVRRLWRAIKKRITRHDDH